MTGLLCHEKKSNIPGSDTHDKPINIPNPTPTNPGYNDNDNKDDPRRKPDPTENR